MNYPRRLMLAVFSNQHDLIGAIREVRGRGLTIVDVFTPYAVHGLDRALGWAPSRLSRACFALGLTGAALMFFFEFWASAGDWPVNIGGKPWNSLPAFVPVGFEFMVLSAGLGSVFVFFLIARLWPGKGVRLPHPRVTDDRFVLLLEETDARFDPVQVKALLRRHHAETVEERMEGASA